MAFIFAVETDSFWQPEWYNPNPLPQPNPPSPHVLIIPLLTCVIYITLYPLIDFLFIALSEESDEGLTPFHKFLNERIINRWNNKIISLIVAISLYFLGYILPILLTWIYNPSMVMVIWFFIVLVYPLLILTFYGTKGYISGISNAYYHIPDMSRSMFLGFEDPKRNFQEFLSDPGSRIAFGLMIFVHFWGYVSIIQTMTIFVIRVLPIGTGFYTTFVFVQLLFGIVGYFTRFWGRKIKYRGIDVYFAAFLMAAVGVNVLVNFLMINSAKLSTTLGQWHFTDDIVPSFYLFAFAAIIEEIILISFTLYYFLSKKSEFTENVRYSKITECGQTFDPIPLFNFLKVDNERLRQYSEETLILMYERIPNKEGVDINSIKIKNPVIDAVSDYHPNARRVGLRLLNQLEKDVPDTILPWIIDALQSPNYDKSVPFAKSLLNAEISLLKKVPTHQIFNLVADPDWRLKLLGLKLLSRLIQENKDLINEIEIHDLIEDPDYNVQVEVLNMLADASIPLPMDSLVERISHKNKEIRAAAIRNLKNLNPEKLDYKIISEMMPLLKDPNSIVRASIFEVMAKLGNIPRFHIPITPFMDGLTDRNAIVRKASVQALEKFYDIQPENVNLDDIIAKIDPNDNEALSSVLSLLGKLWEKDPQKILFTLLIFIKFENEQLKSNISRILIDKFDSHPDMILKNLIGIPDVSKFITKGIIAKTLIEFGKKKPKKVIPFLVQSAQSDNHDIKFNAINSLEGLAEEHADLIDLKPFIEIVQEDTEQKTKKEVTKIISKMAKIKPESIKPVMPIILTLINEQETSVRISFSKAILDIAKESPEIIPVRPIISLLEDKDSFIRETSAKILGYIGNTSGKIADETSEALLTKGLSDEDWIVREASISSLGRVIEFIENKDDIVNKLIDLMGDREAWVRRSSINILTNIKGIKASQIPFATLSKSLSDDDPKVREAAAGLVKIYSAQIERLYDKIFALLEDDSEEVRKSMISAIVEVIQKIGLSKILTDLLKNLSDEGSLELQRSTALILSRTAKYENEKIKKRIISLLKIRCEMSQDPTICGVLNEIRES